MKRVEVEWDDSVTHSAPWHSPEDAINDADSMHCTSVGYLVHDGERSIVLAQSLSFNRDGGIEEYGQPITIPRASLTAPLRVLSGE